MRRVQLFIATPDGHAPQPAQAGCDFVNEMSVFAREPEGVSAEFVLGIDDLEETARRIADADAMLVWSLSAPYGLSGTAPRLAWALGYAAACGTPTFYVGTPFPPVWFRQQLVFWSETVKETVDALREFLPVVGEMVSPRYVEVVGRLKARAKAQV